MSKNINNVSLVGTVGKVEINDAKKFAKLAIAVNQKYKDKEGAEQTKTTWHYVTSFKLDELQEIDKGTKVIVKGKLDCNSYQDKEGNNKISTSIVAFEVTKADKNLNIKAQQNLEFAGNLTKDPEIITSKDGKEFASITLANNSAIKLEEHGIVPKGYTLSLNSKEWAVKPNFVNISVFDKASVESLKQQSKGQRLKLNGVLDVSEYQDKDGNNKRAIKVKVLEGQKVELVKKVEKTKQQEMDR